MYRFRLGAHQRRARRPADLQGISMLTWRQGDTIPLNAERTLRVLGVRDDDADKPPVLVVEDVSAASSGAR